MTRYEVLQKSLYEMETHYVKDEVLVERLVTSAFCLLI